MAEISLLEAMMGFRDFEKKVKQVRVDTAEAATRLTKAEFVDLVRQLGDPGGEAGVKAALVRLGDRAVEALILGIEGRVQSTTIWGQRRRWAAAEVLGKIGGARAQEALIAALDDPDEELRKCAAHALSNVPGPLATAALARASSGSDRYEPAERVRVSNDHFGRAIKTTLEHLQDRHRLGTFSYADLPPLDADYRTEANKKLLQFKATGVVALSSPDKMANSSILKELKEAGLIDTVGYELFQLT